MLKDVLSGGTRVEVWGIMARESYFRLWIVKYKGFLILSGTVHTGGKSMQDKLEDV